MELRNHRSKEAKLLRELLLNFDVYEDGLNIDEMRNMYSALMESVETTDLSDKKQEDMDWDECQPAIQPESKSSTIKSNDSDDSSSECGITTFVTKATVHHSMDWSPSWVGNIDNDEDNNETDINLQQTEHNQNNVVDYSRDDINTNAIERKIMTAKHNGLNMNSNHSVNCDTNESEKTSLAYNSTCVSTKKYNASDSQHVDNYKRTNEPSR